MNRRPVTEPLEPERKEWLEQMAAKAIQVEPRMAELQQRLLELGGEAPAFTFLEPDIEQLLERGQPFGGRSRLKIGPGKCHENSALLWNKNRDTMFIATGYALSEDGVWRQHSWI